MNRHGFFMRKYFLASKTIQNQDLSLEVVGDVINVVNVVNVGVFQRKPIFKSLWRIEN